MINLFCIGVDGADDDTPTVKPANSDTRRDARIRFRNPASLEALPHYLFAPGKIDPERPPLVAVHGISRNAQEHAEAFADLAEASGRLLVAPLFGQEQCRRYQKVTVDPCRADLALIATLVQVAAETGVRTDRIDLFGFSGGSQFAHRFAMLHPARVRRLALSSAGWYTFPTRSDSFPYGIGEKRKEGRRIAAALDRVLAIPTLVLVGAQDQTRDAGLRKGPRVDLRQGFTRVERAARWTEAMRAVAEVRRIEAQFELQILGGCGHSFADCVGQGGLAKKVMRWFEMA